MRKVWTILAALIFTTSAHAQIVGGVACLNATAYQYAEVRVSLLDGDMKEKQYRTITAEELVAPGVVVEFAKSRSDYAATGIRIRCSFVSTSDVDVDAYEHTVAMHWRTNRPQVPQGAQARLEMNVEAVEPGRLLLWIGQKPASQPSGTGI